MYKCPFNYIGSKSQILPVLLDILDDYNDYVLVDLFAGGFSLGINAKNNKVIYNDINNDLTKLIQIMSKEDFNSFDSKIKDLVTKYSLSKTNSEGYKKLREDFNLSRDSYLFALLIFYSFNHQIRYNKSLEFNTPFGKNRSSYNETTRKKLETFFNLLHSKNIEFNSNHFQNIVVNSNMVVYADPPYLLTTGSYNDGKRGVSSWGIKEEKELYNYLDSLNEKKIPFVLSNMLKKGNKVNEILDEWSRKYRIIEVKTNYKNYRRKKENEVEVIVVNFK